MTAHGTGGSSKPHDGRRCHKEKRKKLKREGDIGESHGGVMNWFWLLLVNPTFVKDPEQLTSLKSSVCNSIEEGAHRGDPIPAPTSDSAGKIIALLFLAFLTLWMQT